jgi:superfamily II DNA or RNA helicase
MSGIYVIGSKPGADYAERIKRLRGETRLTQQALADRLGVSFATVNRWENRQTKPSRIYWNQLQQLEMRMAEDSASYGEKEEKKPLIIDFTAQPEVVKVLAEGERLSFGHLANPAFATEISSIDPLPHQRIAVYDHMLKQPRLRFLLADDAGAGKTIMSGLYIREMLSRRLLRRILVVPPAGLVGNWRRELLTLFHLPFRIVTGADARADNPFQGEAGDRVIISVDTMASPRMFARLRETTVAPYDLVIFDEAHKLAADRGNDLRVRKTDRYCLAEAIAGVQSRNSHWRLGWNAHHLLLLTATPHMGKDYPYYALWRLLEPEMLATPDAFDEYPREQRQLHFIRRTKEEMVYLDGRPLYPKRMSDTLGYELSQRPSVAQGAMAGEDISEQKLYDETTDYLRFVYNKAKLLNREAARLAMSVFQRRLASSTYALLRSFERRMEKLNALIEDIQDGKITPEQMMTFQARLHEDDLLDTTGADDEGDEECGEAHEAAEDRLLQGVVAASLADLLAEKEQVKGLLDLAGKVHNGGHESKFDKLREVLTDSRFSGEKFIVFTEHRDTLEFLVRRLGGMGYTGQIAQIHGGMQYLQREEEVERFRKPLDQGGARFLVCTDAAGEGINLQFCWIMINYDVPWNPARLEQRMGRIHRYGQKHDPVVIMNLVAPATREGRVLKVLLDKLEKIRKELQSDKVFDCIGRIFEGVSIKRYMELAVTEDADSVARQLDGRLTKEQIEAVAKRENSLYGAGGDVAKELPRLRVSMEQEVYFRLMPGYIRQYIRQAAPLLDIEIDGDMDGVFSLRPLRFGAMDPLFPVLELYSEQSRDNFSVVRPTDRKDVIWLHPGEPVFDRFRDLAIERLSEEGTRGAVFIDPSATRPYLFHLARISVIRKADIPEAPADAETRYEYDAETRRHGDTATYDLPASPPLRVPASPSSPASPPLRVPASPSSPASPSLRVPASPSSPASPPLRVPASSLLSPSPSPGSGLDREETLECRLVGICQQEGSEIEICPVEHLLLLKGGHGLPASAQRLAVAAADQKELARAYLVERVARGMALERKKALADSVPEREGFIRRGFDYQETELATARAKHSGKARNGNRKAMEALEEVKRQQRELAARRRNALAVLRREPDLIAPGEITFVAHALVVPSFDSVDIEQHETNVEMAAMQVAQAFEEAAGAKVLDVHTPELARQAGLPDNPGFDLLSIRPVQSRDAETRRGGDAEPSASPRPRVSASPRLLPDRVPASAYGGKEIRCIEVKGRATTGDIEVSANEWAKACNMREDYWLYAVYNCATPNPRLARVQDPFGNLLAKAKGSVLVSHAQVVEAEVST